MAEPEYYAGRCPGGGELLCPLERIEYPDGTLPVLLCPSHQCAVPVGVIPKEQHDAIWHAYLKHRASAA